MTGELRLPLACRDLFQALADEMAELRAMLLRLELALTTPVQGLAADISSTDLQQLDLVLQVLDDLAGLAWSLGQGAARDIVVDMAPVLAALRLERVRSRFDMGRRAAKPEPGSDDSIALF